jgi:hypothetical protein
VLHIRFDLVFGVFLLFMVAVVWRSAVHLFQLLGPGWRDHVGDAVPSNEEDAR